MGTEVLRPQDCLIERIRVPPAAISRRRSYGNYCNYNNHTTNLRSSRKPEIRPDRHEQRRRVVVPSLPVSEPLASKRSSSDDLRMAKSSSLVMDNVTILRRGQSLDSKFNCEAFKKEGDNMMVYPAVNSDMYAGSAFAMSPSPSALPLPSFSKKKQASAVVDDSATRDLRRLLRLE